MKDEAKYLNIFTEFMKNNSSHDLVLGKLNGNMDRLIESLTNTSKNEIETLKALTEIKLLTNKILVETEKKQNTVKILEDVILGKATSVEKSNTANKELAIETVKARKEVSKYMWTFLQAVAIALIGALVTYFGMKQSTKKEVKKTIVQEKK